MKLRVGFGLPAEEYYQKELTRDPTDQNAKDMLAKLKEARRNEA